MEQNPNAINRLDVSYNEGIQIKVTTAVDVTKRQLQMKALEAILTDMIMDEGGDPSAALKRIINELSINRKASDSAPEETLIERFKRYYADYRQVSDEDSSFTSAFLALTHSAINESYQHAQASELDEVLRVLREYCEIRDSISESNDSVKERFERETMLYH